jgi:hypothetical protein
LHAAKERTGVEGDAPVEAVAVALLRDGHLADGVELLERRLHAGRADVEVQRRRHAALVAHPAINKVHKIKSQ